LEVVPEKSINYLRENYKLNLTVLFIYSKHGLLQEQGYLEILLIIKPLPQRNWKSAIKKCKGGLVGQNIVLANGIMRKMSKLNL